MSFILDALKKSETDRQQQAGAEFSNVPSSSAGDRPSLKWVWILVGLLAINFAVLLGILLRLDSPAQAPVATPPPASVPAESAVADPPSFEEQIARAREREADRELAAAAVPDDTPTVSAPATTTAPQPATTTTRTSPRVMTIDELRLSGALQIPELHLDILVYSEVPEERFAFINMVKQREQSTLDEGPVVSEITPEGVILDYRGTKFLLPRE